MNGQPKIVEISPSSGGVAEKTVRIGLISPASDRRIESDFWRMASATGAEVFTTRTPLEMPVTVQSLANMERGISHAAALLLPDHGVDVVVFGCTSGATNIGPDRVAQRINEVIRNVAVTNPVSAILAALEHFGTARIALLTPYTPEVSETVANFLANQGKAVVEHTCLNLTTEVAISAVPPICYVEAIKSMRLSEVEAIVVSCTATRTLDAIEEIERLSGLPVITSNQAAFWHAMRLANSQCGIGGFGNLFWE